jgi:hypothetical protein
VGPFAVRQVQVQPDIEEFVRTEPGNVVGMEAVRAEKLASDVVVPLERGNPSADRAFGNYDSRGLMGDANRSLGHSVTSVFLLERNLQLDGSTS